MMFKKINISTVLVIYYLSIIYLFPISLSVGQENHYIIYSFTRLASIPFALFIVFYYHKISIMNIVLGLIIAFKAIFYGGEIAGAVYLLSVFICVDYLIINPELINVDLIKKCFDIFSVIFLLQIVICSIKYRAIVSLVGDKNYLGYFIFFVYVYYVYSKKKLKWLWFILGALTFSRNFFVAIIIFWIISLVSKKMVKKQISDKATKNVWLMGQISIIPITFIYCRLFESNVYQYVYRSGISRVIHFFDESNYLRFKVNELAWHTQDISSLMLGFREGSFSGLSFYSGKLLYPHNTFLVIMVQMGIVAACLYMIQFVRLIKRFNGSEHISFWMALIPYQLFLGPSSFYGVELIIIFAILLLTREGNNKNEGS